MRLEDSGLTRCECTLNRVQEGPTSFFVSKSILDNNCWDLYIGQPRAEILSEAFKENSLIR